MNAAADHIFVLRTTRKQSAATKRFSWNATSQTWVKTSYGMGSRFFFSRHSVSCIQDLGKLVERTRRDPQAFIIRGEIAPDRQPDAPVNRRYRVKPDAAEPDFVDAPRAWLMADIDGWKIPDGFDLVEDVDLLVERAITELLPPQFHDVEAFWQLSSSAGFASGTLKAHVWFYLDRRIETLLLKRWMLLNARGIDQALFNVVQIHYTADPLIEGGPDPVPRRTGWVRGERDVVTLPDLNADDLAAETRAKHRETAAANGMSPSQAATLDGALASIGDGNGLGGFHDPLRRAAWLYATKTAPWQRDLAAIKDRFTAAILRAPIDLKRRTGVSEYLTDDYLDRLIRGAFDKLPDGGGWEACAPEHAPRADDVEASRIRMREAIGAFLAEPTVPPPVIALAMDPDLEATPRRGLVVAEVGLGKTAAALEEIATFIAREKAAGRPHRVAYFIPEHRLGAELVIRAEAIGISTAAWRGRHYVDPITKRAMCDDTASVQAAESAGARVDKFVCGSLAGKTRCGSFFACAYQQARPAADQADLVVAAHATMFNVLPAEITHDLGLIVIDEGFWQAGLRQTAIAVETFSVDPIEHPVMRRDAYKQQVIHEEKTNDLHAIRAMVQKAFEASPKGYFQRQHVEAAGLTTDLCSTAGRLEWERLRDVPMWPGMPLDERKEAAKAVAINAQLPRMHSFWTVLRELLESDGDATGRIEVQRLETKAGSQEVALLNTCRALSSSVLACPILLLDGTGDLDVVRHFLPGVELLAEERPAQPHVTIRQVVGGLSKTSLAARPELVAELRDFVALASGGEPSLVVTHKQFEKLFEGLPNVQVAHFGAVAGRDEWGSVRHLFSIGRPQPSPNDARAMTAQLTGKPVPLADPVKTDRGVLMADGRGVAIEVSRFDDPDVEAVRAAVTDSAVVQGCGRGRGVNRQANNPLDVWIIGNVIVPWAVDDLVQWSDLALSPVGRMAARGAVLASPSDATVFYPDLFATVEAAKKTMQRAGLKGDFGDIPLLRTLYKGMSPKSVRYRPTGRGQQNRTAWVLANRLDGFREWLENQLGPLAAYAVGDVPPDPATEPPSSAQPTTEATGPSADDLARWEQQFTDEPDPSTEPPAWWEKPPPWTPADLEWITATPDDMQTDVLDAERQPMPEMQITDRDQPGFEPAAVYRRGLLEPPCADQFTIRQPGQLPIAIRGRPGALTQAPRSALIWLGTPSPVPFTPDCSRWALLPEAEVDVRRIRPEPGVRCVGQDCT